MIFEIFDSFLQSCDNEPPNFEGLHESIVDSDEEDGLADSIDVRKRFCNVGLVCFM